MMTEPKQNSDLLRTSLSGRVFRSTLNGSAILFMLLAMVIVCISPDATAALTLVPPWCWCLPGMASVIILWRLTGHRLKWLLTVAWLVFVIVYVEEPFALARSARWWFWQSARDLDHSVRIVSLNCANTEKCVTDLKRVNPDIVLIQEVPGEDGLARMAARLFGEEGCFHANGDCAILARGQIQGQKYGARQEYVVGTVKLDGNRELKCVSLRLKPPVSRLDFWNSGFWLDHRAMRHHHRQELQQVIFDAADHAKTSAFIVGGDFNTMPIDPALAPMRQDFTDSFTMCGIGWGATGTNDWPLFRVDHVWVNREVTPVRTFAVKTDHSDHRMVVCDAVVR